MSLKAIIFDFNGIIINDEPIHFKMFQKVLKEEGIRLTSEDYFSNYLAYDDRNCFIKILRKSKKPTPLNKIRELICRKAVYYDAYIKNHLCIFPGAKKWVSVLSKQYPLAIASAALKHEILWVLKKSKLINKFKIIVSSEDTKKSKPDPESYLLALKKLNRFRKIKADECLVIEDSFAGIHGAHRAKMKCLALEHTYNRSQLKDADLIFKNFSNFDLAKIQELFQD